MSDEKRDSTERKVVRQAAALVRSPEFQRLIDAALSGRSCEVAIMGTLIVVEHSLPPGYCGMSLFEEKGFVLGPEAFTSTEQLHRTILWELYRLKTHQAEAAIIAGEAGRLRSLTAAFVDRVWPWFCHAIKSKGQR
jgi:hypothetical protein